MQPAHCARRSDVPVTITPAYDARMAKTPRLEAAAFTIEEGTITRVTDGSRAVFRFNAPATRHLADAGYEVDVYIVLFDAQGRVVRRRSCDRSSQLLGARAQWVHEVDNDMVAAATTAVYDIQHRVDYRRKITAGELPPLPPEADGSDYFRWGSLDPRTLEDRMVKLDLSFWARRSYFEISYAQTAKTVVDSCRSEFEIELLDAERQLLFQRTFSASTRFGRGECNDTSISMDRKAMRQIRFFELRGKTEVNALAQLPIADLAGITETP
jgi:hypothetical protein